MNIVEVEHLKLWDWKTNAMIVQDSSFQLKQGSCLAIVGESGSGKSVTCKAIMRLNKPSIGQSGSIRFNGQNMAELAEQDMRKMRGKKLCMIMQNGMRAFDPSCVIGVHVKETLNVHYGWSKSIMIEKMSAAMQRVRLGHPLEVMNKYPHQLSGGMLQRVMIALALVLKPDVIIADEPTTALDTVSQYEVVEQLLRLRAETGSSMLFISHDLGVVKKVADEVLVMKEGIIVESGAVASVFANPVHEYTKYLLATRQALSEHFRAIMGGGAALADRDGCGEVV